MKDIFIAVLNLALLAIAFITGFFIFLWLAVAVLGFYVYLRIRFWLLLRKMKNTPPTQETPESGTVIDAEYEIVEEHKRIDTAP